MLHVLTDTLASVQAIVAAGLIATFGGTWVDPIASVLIALLVVYSAWSLLRQAVSVLMESAPGDVDVDAIREALLALPGVDDVYDLHVWSITLSSDMAMSAGAVLPVGTVSAQDVKVRTAEGRTLSRHRGVPTRGDVPSIPLRQSPGSFDSPLRPVPGFALTRRAGHFRS